VAGEGAREIRPAPSNAGAGGIEGGAQVDRGEMDMAVGLRAKRSTPVTSLLAPSITRRLIGRFAKRLAVDTAMSHRLERLTDREREVAAAVARGSSNPEICKELFIGAAMVKSHVSSILTKLGLRDRAQIVVFAYESGLVEVGDRDIGC
jgi:DNA-binding NarL/FixJ family response regulator